MVCLGNAMLCPVALCVCVVLVFCSACLPPPPSCLQPFTPHLPDLPTHNWLTTLYTTLNTVHCTQFFHTFNDFKSTQTTTQLFFTDMRHNVYPHTTCSQLSHTYTTTFPYHYINHWSLHPYIISMINIIYSHTTYIHTHTAYPCTTYPHRTDSCTPTSPTTLAVLQETTQLVILS